MLPDCTQVAEAGKLYVIGTPIGNLADISLRALSILTSVDLIACEDTRVSAKLLAYLKIKKPLVSYRDENESTQSLELASKLQNGTSIALISDAGTPAISDPGFRLVRLCRKMNLPVVPIPGPSAFVSALSASGLPSDQFTFIGFLPPKSAARQRFFESIQQTPVTQILYESSHRIEKFFKEIKKVLGEKRIICIAREITKLHETFLVGEISQISQKFEMHSKKGEFVIIIAPYDFIL